MLKDGLILENRGASTRLVVLLHSYVSTTGQMSSLRSLVRDTWADADIFCPSYDARALSKLGPSEIVDALLAAIDRIHEDRGGTPYDDIIFIGHSLGSLLLRQVYVKACGIIGNENTESSLGAPRPWAKDVSRIVLLAGMNRGWSIDHHLGFKKNVAWHLGEIITGAIQAITRRPRLILQVRRGAPFITHLRIHWLRMRRHAATSGVGNALVIQLLGSVDDLVSPEDNIDLVSGGDFMYLDVPYSGHSNVIALDDKQALPSLSNHRDRGLLTVGEVRRNVISTALSAPPEEIKKRAILPDDTRPPDAIESVKKVVFVLHGIRDKGFWTHKIARQVKRIAREEGLDLEIATETASYGYFPMLLFLMPGMRRAKLEWFLDRYVHVRAMYPNAEFSFVGHSNGTYLLARALEEYPWCKFKNVVLLGSVIRRRYDWSTIKARHQVENVWNFTTTKDYIVAIFPNTLQKLKLQDLGSAGHDGFDDADRNAFLNEVRYVPGTHSAAKGEDYWDAIGRFVLTGEPARVMEASEQSKLVKLLGKCAPLVVLFLIALACLVAYGLWLLSPNETVSTLLVAIYFILVYKVLVSY